MRNQNKSPVPQGPRGPERYFTGRWGRELWGPVFLFFLFSGCQSTTPGNVGRVQSYAVPSVEAEWIRNGEPIEFEDALWFPADDVEVFLDSEMIRVGECKGVPFFINKFDVRPYNRLYTKFGRNQFRYFLEKETDDPR